VTPGTQACNRCHGPFPLDQLLEGFCEKCIYLMAEAQTKAGGILSREAIREAKDELVDHVEAGEDVLLAKQQAKNEIQSLGGIGACREMIKMAEGLGQFAHQVEEDARRKLGVLMKLRKT
jgi:hypothetical protein